MLRKNKNTLYCFSPPVMVATIIIEISLVVYSFVRLKSSNLKNSLLVTLILLAIFQYSEFFVCGNGDISKINIASRVGYVAITYLPAVGILIANQIAGRKHHWSSILSLSLATIFAVYFSVLSGSINSAICAGNYVIFNLITPADRIYGLYYFGITFWMIMLSLLLSTKVKAKKDKQALQWLIVAVLAFIVPTGIVYMINPATVEALPSIMCGFAVLYALILTTKVATKLNK